jgi:hypothetical protein
MSKHVCVLAPWEVDEMVEKGQIPNCSKHRHVKVSDAEEMTRKNGRLYYKPIAEWVGDEAHQGVCGTRFGEANNGWREGSDLLESR